MELKYKGSFKRDLEKCNKAITQLAFEAITQIKLATSENQIQNLKKLRNYKNLYRIKLSGGYRIGISIKNKKVWMVRIGHRNNFYNKFP
jgi:mRNA-degrading endonuclease RelE of RelBE toxin-antitoxin system